LSRSTATEAVRLGSRILNVLSLRVKTGKGPAYGGVSGGVTWSCRTKTWVDELRSFGRYVEELEDLNSAGRKKVMASANFLTCSGARTLGEEEWKLEIGESGEQNIIDSSSE